MSDEEDMSDGEFNYVEFKIDNGEDRDNMVLALASAGYKVWIKNVSPPSTFGSGAIFVCVEKP